MHCLRGKATMPRFTSARSTLVCEVDGRAERPALVHKYHPCRFVAGPVASQDSEKYVSMLGATDCRAPQGVQ